MDNRSQKQGLVIPTIKIQGSEMDTHARLILLDTNNKADSPSPTTPPDSPASSFTSPSPTLPQKNLCKSNTSTGASIMRSTTPHHQSRTKMDKNKPKPGTTRPPPGFHVVFKTCLECKYTPSYPTSHHICPECSKPTFVTACTECGFESGPDCPLSTLLDHRPRPAGPTLLELLAEAEQRRNEPWQSENGSLGEVGLIAPPAVRRETLKLPPSRAAKIIEQDERRGRKRHTARSPLPHSNSFIRMAKEEKAGELAKLVGGKQNAIEVQESLKSLSIQSDEAQSSLCEHCKQAFTTPVPPASTKCEHCGQSHCSVCLRAPGDRPHASLVLSMADFSATFAELHLCNLCKHNYCPGSALVHLRCPLCGHDGCGKCERRTRKCEEEWAVCCACGETAWGRDEDAITSKEQKMADNTMVANVLEAEGEARRSQGKDAGEKEGLKQNGSGRKAELWDAKADCSINGEHLEGS